MLFQKTWQQVLDGTKTQTRRLVHPDDADVLAYVPDLDSSLVTEGNRLFARLPVDQLSNFKISYVERNRRIKWYVGKTYEHRSSNGQGEGFEGA